MKYITNPHKRCIYCDGREVMPVNDEGRVLFSNLFFNDTINSFMCIDRVECRQNVEAESTHYVFYGDESGVKKAVITKNGKLVAEIESQDDEPLDFGGIL